VNTLGITCITFFFGFSVYYTVINLGAFAAATMSNFLPVTLRAASIAKAHTVLACSAFLSALFIGYLLHYEKIVKNGVAGYPQEWFPSVSAT